MRLWQKIFLLTLCLTALVANAISLVLLTRNQADSLLLAKKRIGTICDGAIQELGHLIQEEREAKGCLMLTESEMEAMMAKARLDADGQLFLTDSVSRVEKTTDSVQNAGKEPDGEGSIDIQENEICIEPVAGVFKGVEGMSGCSAARETGTFSTSAQASDFSISAGTDSFSISTKLLPMGAENVITRLVKAEGKIRIHMATTAFWEGHFYRVEVSSDLSELFGRFREDLVFCQWMSGMVSLLTAAVLLCSILYLTRPLKRLEAATEQIAGGEYGYRIPVKGSDEIAELSRHMNEMASEVEASIRRVEEFARGRETFIANMAHELKTPLTSILGFADIMTIKSDMDEAERREYASVISAEAKRLKLLSSRLMELIAIQETELTLRSVNFGELTERALEVFAPVCATRQCRVRRRLEPLWVEADEALLTSLVLNLLDNALKASSPGQEIEVTLEEREGSALLTIRDEGRGIPEAELERVTEAFYMVDKARSRGEGGSGVGLALCKAIMEAHHGSMEIESREGYGTRVSVVLPCHNS